MAGAAMTSSERAAWSALLERSPESDIPTPSAFGGDLDIRSSWTIDARGFARPLGTEPAWTRNRTVAQKPLRHTPAKRGPKPDPVMAEARAELRRRALERAAAKRRARGEVRR